MKKKGLSKRALVDSFLESCKPRENWLVGMEVEKMGRIPSDGRPIPYDGSGPSVRRVLEAYHALRGGDPVYEGDLLIGMAGHWGTLSLEPGASASKASFQRKRSRTVAQSPPSPSGASAWICELRHG